MPKIHAVANRKDGYSAKISPAASTPANLTSARANPANSTGVNARSQACTSISQNVAQSPAADELVARICSNICPDARSSRAERPRPEQAAGESNPHEPHPNTGECTPPDEQSAPADAAVLAASSLHGPRPREQYRCKPADFKAPLDVSAKLGRDNPPEARPNPATIALPNEEAGGRPPKATPRCKKMQKRIQVNFRADPDVKDALRYIWYKRGMTMSEACNEAIRTCFPEAFKNSKEAELTQEL